MQLLDLKAVPGRLHADNRKDAEYFPRCGVKDDSTKSEVMLS